jgi:imidazolonepropionase
VGDLSQETPVEFVPTFLGPAIPEDFQSAPDRYVSLVIDEMLPRIADERLAEFCDVFCERGYFDVETS